MRADERSCEGSRGQLSYSDTGSGPATLLIHGSVAGIPYGGSRRIWGPFAELLLQHGHRVIAFDRPGSGASTVVDAEALGVGAAVESAAELIDHLKLTGVHVVGHGEGGLVALLLATQRADVASCTLIAAHDAAPTGDSPEQITLQSVPLPRHTVRSQRWTLDQLSYGVDYIDDRLLAQMTDAARASAEAAALWQANERQLRTEHLVAKDRLYGYARECGFTLPVTLIWGTHDPLSGMDRAVELMNLLATTSAPLELRAANRVGHFAFREQPVQIEEITADAIARAEGAA